MATEAGKTAFEVAQQFDGLLLHLCFFVLVVDRAVQGFAAIRASAAAEA